ncbi:DUF2520 domain-containing protein [Sandaracinomonas limnophila]|uniref:DUF2520 domain-containing protein n=1 Tax=Sandaracinomonas limnophila TaxID=1862386 RepID=A0A437PUJ3_9BACT|nr:DUF2520 domain-containing protein [Sandaracinomonas limnophila]RVU25922.1 DUF2520 domain-containing protein [Sandaracinomonas limnophila]
MKISFIGAGNAAWQLSRSFENAGETVMEVFSRHATHARDLVKYLYNAHIQEHLDFSESSSSVFFLCIPESAYAQVLPELILPKDATLILVTAHFSLNEAADLYDPVRENNNPIGIFYPVQYLQKGVNTSFDQCMICIEGDSPTTELLLSAFGKKLSKIVYAVSEEERKKIHLASLFAGDFTRLLWNQAEGLLKEIELESHLIQPLIRNHLAHLQQNFPYLNRAEREFLSHPRYVRELKDELDSNEYKELFEQFVKMIKKGE